MQKSCSGEDPDPPVKKSGAHYQAAKPGWRVERSRWVLKALNRQLEKPGNDKGATVCGKEKKPTEYVRSPLILQVLE
jgi:hypothetical protein